MAELRHRVLLVEDSRTQAEHLRSLLAAEGYAVEVASSAAAALVALERGAPDVIVSDIQMPGMDGHALCEAVKSAERTRAIPFVLMTERSDAVDIIAGLERGADGFISKAFAGRDLVERIRAIVERPRLTGEGGGAEQLVLRLGERQVPLTADKRQIVELLCTVFADLVHANAELRESRRTVEAYAARLEAMVEERTRRLVQAEKLAWMGQLLAGVAHELNNPLAIVVWEAEVVRRLVGEAPAHEHADRITRAAHRCAEIVQNFLALARRESVERRPTSLTRVVEDALDLLETQLRADGIEVHLDLAPDVPEVMVDGHELHQVVVNLISNARQAMEGRPASRLQIRLQADASRGRVILAVADNGSGIAPDIRERIFDPFFTTKPAGRGTGLGLALCRNIVQAHGGTIDLDSAPGRGTTFVIELPLAPPPIPEAPRPDDAATAVELTGKRVLVVEDEPGILDMLRDFLVSEGAVVETATEGHAALRRLEAAPFDLILTDMKMPDCDGPAFYRSIGDRWPELVDRLVFLTADVLSDETRQFLHATRAVWLAKPFRADDLRRAVDQCLSIDCPRAAH